VGDAQPQPSQASVTYHGTKFELKDVWLTSFAGSRTVYAASNAACPWQPGCIQLTIDMTAVQDGAQAKSCDELHTVGFDTGFITGSGYRYSSTQPGSSCIMAIYANDARHFNGIVRATLGNELDATDTVNIEAFVEVHAR
jgi:hypothetical protein